MVHREPQAQCWAHLQTLEAESCDLISLGGQDSSDVSI